MTIKITKQPPAHYSAECSKCGCEFTYERNDIRHRYSLGASNVITCPVCGHLVPHRVPW